MIHIIRHKDYDFPIPSGYVTCEVGPLFKGDRPNINYLNPIINELTGIYDVWKNFDVEKLLKVPQFDYEWDNEPLIAEWEKILDKHPKRKKKTGEVELKVTRDYYDTDLQRGVRSGERIMVRPERADKITYLGYGERV